MKNKVIDSIIYNSLVYHITMTIFQNTPDPLVPSLKHFSPGWDIPQWRFFAPTPAISNHHIFYRVKGNNDEEWSKWEELSPEVKPTLLSAIWNPSGRYTKANFDITNSLIDMISYGATFEFIKSSENYSIISSIINGRLSGTNALKYQFMVAISTPNKSTKEGFSFEPKFFSELHEVN